LTAIPPTVGNRGEDEVDRRQSMVRDMASRHCASIVRRSILPTSRNLAANRRS
jgi:hypothetical protein